MKISIFSCLAALLMLTPPSHGGIGAAVGKAVAKVAKSAATAVKTSPGKKGALDFISDVPMGGGSSSKILPPVKREVNTSIPRVAGECNPNSNVPSCQKAGGVRCVWIDCVNCGGCGIISDGYYEVQCNMCRGQGGRFYWISK